MNVGEAAALPGGTIAIAPVSFNLGIVSLNLNLKIKYFSDGSLLVQEAKTNASKGIHANFFITFLIGNCQFIFRVPKIVFFGVAEAVNFVLLEKKLMINNLQTIPSAQINVEKWNACVAKNNAPIYLQYAYLNTMANNWTGLVINDYEAVMPICFRKKMGITYSYSPAFVQQLGWVGQIKISWQEIEKAIFGVVKYGDVMLNHSNHFEAIRTIAKTNFVINLNKNYEEIYSNYKNDLKQNLKKAIKENLVYTANNNIDEAIDLYKDFYSNRMKGLSAKDYSNFKMLCLLFHQTNNCLLRQIVNNKNELLAVALLLKDENRIYNLANSTTAAGRNTEANHFLIDSILKEFANTNLIFDFEGSDLPGVKTFYQKFGAVDEPYFHWHFNKLPWWIKWVKND